MNNKGFQSDVQMEKSILIDPITAKQMEREGKVLQSDGYMDKFDRERNMPINTIDAVDAETAMRLAKQQGVALSLDGSAPVIPTSTPVVAGKNIGSSKMPSPILESFKAKPPLVPTAPQNELNPEFLSKIKDATTRMNNVLGETARKTQPEQPMGGQTVRRNEPVYNPAPTASAPVDYSLIRMIMKETVREALAEIDLKEVVKEVLTEEKQKMSTKTVNENIVVKLGETILAGKVTRIDQPQTTKK